MTGPIVALVDVLEGVQKVDPVLIALENGFLVIAAEGDMIDGTGIF